MQNIETLVNFLASANPDALQRMRQAFPEALTSLTPGKMLGAEVAPEAENTMLQALFKETLSTAKQTLEPLLFQVMRRTKSIRRVRLAGGVVSSALSAGLIAALAKGWTHEALIIAAITFLSSMLTLTAQYYEDSLGGNNSLNNTRITLNSLQRQLAEAEGHYQLSCALNDFVGLVDMVKSLSKLLVELQVIRNNYV
ncbi:hypothetical protein HRH59_11370 [Rheinheimera sp. YQF-2]|uniref:SMODS and SLOG-associating 2TM effector domain-containing protein n=1 Tax=Rheinheimera lutimaris TaxID=2740584 RepID=A0A7Y5EIU6_9GAMM|nr:hypothetical protein [Rheinheimera lutimaris]NRQ43142.1 hypothetical protein [Rheinheimera lutimaris]